MTSRDFPDHASIPAASVGVGFKPEHAEEALHADHGLGFFEVHAENYMGDGGAPHRMLTELRVRAPLSVHGVALSIGGAGPLNREHLARLKRVIDRYEPALFSEHLAWSTHDGVYLNDLLPVPYNAETLARVCDHIDEVQETLQRRMLLGEPLDLCRLRDLDHERGRVPARDRQPHRLRPPARREQRLCLRRQSRHRAHGLSRPVPHGACRRDPSRRPFRGPRRSRRAAPDRRARQPRSPMSCGRSTPARFRASARCRP